MDSSSRGSRHSSKAARATVTVPVEVVVAAAAVQNQKKQQQEERSKSKTAFWQHSLSSRSSRTAIGAKLRNFTKTSSASCAC